MSSAPSPGGGPFYLLLLALERLLPGIYPTVNKALGDIILALCSYQIQLRWVFREDGRP